jgi:polar amino acid transport system permease protein
LSSNLEMRIAMKTKQRYNPLHLLSMGLQLICACFLIVFLLFALTQSQSYNWQGIWEYRQLFVQGWLLTVLLSACSLLLSVLIGTLCALCYRSGLPLLHYTAKIYVEFIRGTPLLIQILFFYYVIANNLGLENRYAAGVLILSTFSGAYIAEMMRAGIESVSATQLQAARAIGLTRFQSYRFVIFPQAIRQIIPPLAGQFASIIKDSSLLSIIGINELTNSAQQVNSATYSTLESFFPLAFGYLILTLPISLWSKKLEARFRYET